MNERNDVVMGQTVAPRYININTHGGVQNANTQNAPCKKLGCVVNIGMGSRVDNGAL